MILSAPIQPGYHKQTALESKHQTRHLKFTPFGLRYKLRARHTESLKVLLGTSDTKHDFEQQVYNVHESQNFRVPVFQFCGQVGQIHSSTWDATGHGIPTSSEADWAY